MNAFTKTLALTLLVCGATTAKADTGPTTGLYAVTRISNPLNTPMQYQYRWGNGAWRTTILAAGKVNRHSWRYQFAGQNSSPRLQIRFDADLGRGVFFRTYSLSKYSVPIRTIGGKLYRFRDGSVLNDIVSLRTVN